MTTIGHGELDWKKHAVPTVVCQGAEKKYRFDVGDIVYPNKTKDEHTLVAMYVVTPRVMSFVLTTKKDQPITDKDCFVTESMCIVPSDQSKITTPVTTK